MEFQERRNVVNLCVKLLWKAGRLRNSAVSIIHINFPINSVFPLIPRFLIHCISLSSSRLLNSQVDGGVGMRADYLKIGLEQEGNYSKLMEVSEKSKDLEETMFRYMCSGPFEKQQGLTKMEEVRNEMAKDVLFRSGLNGYKSDKKIQEPQDRRDSRSRCPSFVPLWALMSEAEYTGLNKAPSKPGIFRRLTRPGKNTLRSSR
ncbi:hypothetical protein DY000_02031945 [Brassica cretica]|uniref:Uncharacterized protein n=1 Tax=Brassica cretica TaxID=69181 RepID=A0ABQ7DL36_BRACR|nr:hypothetical protein DY000_02031945 [Brassica cretica]